MQGRWPARRVALLIVAAPVVAAGVMLVVAGLLRALPDAGGRDVAAGSPPIAASSVPSGQPAASPGASPAPSPSPSRPATPPPDPVLVGAGDIARCDASDDEATAALLDRLPGIVFTLGDTAYDSASEAELRDCYGPSWGRFLDRTRFAAAGNHEYGSPGAAPFRAYFGRAAERDGTTWFGDDVGTWHVIVLDANCGQLEGGCGPDSPQLRWLREDLAASRARCTLALWHQPRFSSGLHGSDPSVAPFWDALHAAGADLVVNGHDHDYERFRPQDPDGTPDRERGITQLVVGTGGGDLRDFGPPVPNSVVRSSIAHGVLELTLRPGGWAFRFVSVDGSFSDQGTGRCH
jgi:hypothetical protein